MPIYEFKCKQCDAFFELLVMSNKDTEEVNCPQCNSQTFERVMSTINMKTASGGATSATGPNVQERQCTSGSCSTYTIPGGD